MSRMRLVCYDLSNAQRNGSTVLQVFAQLGEYAQLYPGCVLVVCDLPTREVAEKVAEALRDDDRLVVVEGDEAVIAGLAEHQSERLDALYEKAYPRQALHELTGGKRR